MEISKIKILAIDDNQDNLITIKALIRESFPEALIFTALTGSKGIGLAKSEDPDVILLDIVMPGMDGFEVCKVIKEDKELQDIPVVFVTANKKDHESRIYALECGAEAFLSKPLDEIELTTQIRAMTKIKAAANTKKNEKKRLEELVAEKTQELHKMHLETVSLLQDLRYENERRIISEKGLLKSEAFLKETQLIAKLGTYTFDLTADRWESSELLDQIFGIDVNADKSFNGWVSIIHPDWKRLMSNYFINDVIGSKTKFDKEYMIIRSNDKMERWVHGMGSLKFDENNQPIMLIGTILDISERKANERQLKILSKGIDQSPVNVVITNYEGCIEYINPKFTETTGYSPEEVLGKNPSLLKSGVQPKEFYANLWATILSGNDWHGEFCNKKKNGEYYWESAAISPIIGSDGTISFFIAIKEDITEKKALMRDLVEAKEKAEESDRLKSAFLANMSHEIRTPMNGILGFAELLKEPKLTGEEQAEYIEIIEKSGMRMLNIINDVVDISKIESGQMTLNLRESNINEQLEYIYTFFKPEVDAKNMQLSVIKSLTSKESIINTDREKVFAILTNLVKNAIKYSDKGSIEFGYILNTTSEPYELEFYVRDTGIGIPKGRHEAIFERFIQADIGDKRAYQGAGLGLTISKSYVKMLDGRIWVESQEGNGSTFYFTLPYNGVCKDKEFNEYKVPTADTINIIHSLKILIAEDDKDSVKILEIRMGKYCHNIITVTTGTEAVETCHNNPDIDLIFMDIKMPGIDGYEATRQIRQFNPDVVIIAQTAFALSGDSEKALAAGCNDYISKPIKTDQLMGLIGKYFIN